MNPLDPPPGWPSSAFDDVANDLGAYNQQYGSSYAQHPLSSPSDPVRAAATQRDGSRPLPQQRQQQVSGLDVNASRLYNQWLTSHYQLPPPTGTVNPANLQRDGSGASPGRQQQMPGPDVNASTTYDQPPPYDDSGRYPLLSPLEDMFSTSADPNIYHVAGSHPTFNTLNTTIHGYLSGPLGSFFTHNAGHQQHQQQHQHHPQQQQNPPYPPNPAGAPPAPQQNHAFDFNPPNDHVYNPFHNQNNQTQHPSYANAAPTAPANPLTRLAPSRRPRAPGTDVGTPIPAHLTSLVNALRDLPDAAPASKKHPVRSTLKMPFLTLPNKTEAQQVIRDNFVSGSGLLRSNSQLRKWDGDLTVFPMDFWDLLFQEEPRVVHKDNKGKRMKGKKAKEEKSGEVKKQKMKAGDAAKVEVAGADVGEENAAEGEVREDNVAVDNIAEDDAAESEDTSGQESSSSGFLSGSSEDGAVMLNGLPCNNSGQLLSKSTGDLRGELVAGDANKLFKSGTTADASGRFRKENGKVIGLTSVSRDNSEEGAKEGEDDGAEEGEEGKED